MVRNIGLQDEIDTALNLLKVHVPYFESDHVLNLAYNAFLALRNKALNSSFRLRARSRQDKYTRGGVDNHCHQFHRV